MRAHVHSILPVLAGLATAAPAHAAVLYTSDFGDSLSDAADAAVYGDVLIVDSAVGCSEVDVGVYILGGGGSVDCNGFGARGINLLPGAEGTMILGVPFTGDASYGIDANHVSEVTVADCSFTGFQTSGIRVAHSSGWYILDNTFDTDDVLTDLNDGAIVLNAGVTDVRIEGNHIDATGHGVRLYNAATNIAPIADVDIRDNVITTEAGGAGVLIRSRDTGGTQRDLRIVGNDLSGADTPILVQAASIDFIKGSEEDSAVFDPTGVQGEIFDVYIRDNRFGLTVDHTGGCDSPIVLSRLVPGHRVALGIGAVGSTTIPTGGCAGTTIGLSETVDLLGSWVAPAGNLPLVLSFPADACELALQAIDLDTCEVSDVRSLAHTVFVTSDAYAGDLGGLEGADAICRAHADAAGLNGTWTAWLSTSTVDARDRIGDFTYVNMVGDVIAWDLDDLLDGTLENPIAYTEAGDQLALDNNLVWTGTLNDGTLAEPSQGGTCSDWTGGGQGLVGDPTAIDGWSDKFSLGTSNCVSQPKRFYCFQD